MMLILFTMYFSGGMIPTYLLVKDLGMYNTIWALLIPAALSTYNLIVAKTFLRTVYRENFMNRPVWMAAGIFPC